MKRLLFLFAAASLLLLVLAACRDTILDVHVPPGRVDTVVVVPPPTPTDTIVKHCWWDRRHHRWRCWADE